MDFQNFELEKTEDPACDAVKSDSPDQALKDDDL